MELPTYYHSKDIKKEKIITLNQLFQFLIKQKMRRYIQKVHFMMRQGSQILVVIISCLMRVIALGV